VGFSEIDFKRAIEIDLLISDDRSKMEDGAIHHFTFGADAVIARSYSGSRRVHLMERSFYRPAMAENAL
jgi:hypothetical protein